MQQSTGRSRTGPLVFLFLAVAGCGATDDRLVDLSERSLARQAEQSQQMAQQSTEVVQATRQLVEADAQARAQEYQRLYPNGRRMATVRAAGGIK